MTQPPVEMTIGQMAERSGVATSALRFYERRGLIRSRRNDGNQRRFHRAMLRRVAFIRASQASGISLEKIGEVLQLVGDDEAPNAATWRRASQLWAEEINERIALLERMRDRLTGCIGCGCLSMNTCHLLNDDDKLREEGAGPRRLLHD